MDVDGVRYLWLPLQGNTVSNEKDFSGAARLDVSVEITRAVFLEEVRDVALRKPPLGYKLTCEECRRLADQGAYKESIQAYRTFIQANKGHYQIDDAYFGIAEIFDENLFRFQEALSWYRRLIEEFPESNLTPLAFQRIDFLNTHGDYDFEPLARFERIRKKEYARKRHSRDEREEVLEQVRVILKEFPDASLAPIMQYWLANQYRQSDPDRAVSAYTSLIEKFPKTPKAREAWLEIGETYFVAGRYSDAKVAYAQALDAAPSRTTVIKEMMARAERNLRRRNIAFACWCMVGLFFVLGLLSGSSRGVWGSLKWSTIAFISLGSILSIGGWLIHEQFSSMSELFSLVLGFSASASFGFPLTVGFAEKLMGNRNPEVHLSRAVRSGLLGACLGFIVFAAGMYLTIFYANEHYLVIVKL
jgi:TolA-binding protein